MEMAIFISDFPTIDNFDWAAMTSLLIQQDRTESPNEIKP